MKKRIRSSTVAFAAGMACALALAVHGSAWALTYSENLDDDSALPTEQRLARVDKRTKTLIEREKAVRESHSAFKSAIEQGTEAATKLEQELALFRGAVATRTVSTALGEGAARGLAWHCTRSREVLPQLLRLGATATAALKEHSAGLARIEMGSDGAVTALQALSSRLHSSLSQTLDSEDSQQLRSDLKELEVGLPYAWGSYTTLRRMAQQTKVRYEFLLMHAPQTKLRADTAEEQIDAYLEAHRIIGETLDRIEPKYVNETRVRDDIRRRWQQSSLPGSDADPLGTVRIADLNTKLWQKAAVAAQSAVQDGMRPLSAARDACGDEGNVGNPATDFASTRAVSGQPLGEQFARLDATYAARAAEIARAQTKAAKVAQDNRTEVTELDRKLVKVRESGAKVSPNDQAGQQKLKALLDKGKRLRDEAQQRLALMERAGIALTAEAREVEQQRAALAGLRAKLMTVINSDAVQE